MGKLFADAVCQGLIERNPVSANYPPTHSGTSRKPFTDDEDCAILEACDDEWKRVVNIALMTGLRLTDATRLGCEHYDEQLDAIQIQERKTKKHLTIPVNDTLRGYLSAERVAPRLSQLTTGLLGKRFAKILENAGTERGAHKAGKNTTYKNSFHSLRHNFVSRLTGQALTPKSAGSLPGTARQAYTRYPPTTTSSDCETLSVGSAKPQ